MWGSIIMCRGNTTFLKSVKVLWTRWSLAYLPRHTRQLDHIQPSLKKAQSISQSALDKVVPRISTEASKTVRPYPAFLKTGSIKVFRPYPAFLKTGSVKVFGQGGPSYLLRHTSQLDHIQPSLKQAQLNCFGQGGPSYLLRHTSQLDHIKPSLKQAHAETTHTKRHHGTTIWTMCYYLHQLTMFLSTNWD